MPHFFFLYQTRVQVSKVLSRRIVLTMPDGSIQGMRSFNKSLLVYGGVFQIHFNLLVFSINFLSWICVVMKVC